LHYLSLQCLVSSNPVAKVERTVAVAVVVAAAVLVAVMMVTVATAQWQQQLWW
jgi:hypothetical protein